MSAAPVTLLFTDLVGSTELLQRAGDEQAQRIFRAHHLVLQQAVAIHGGSEVKWLGDGLMSVFASPADALRCAMAMQQAARGRVAGERLAIRVGLNVGEALQEEADYFGTPVVVARRLCDQAAAGQILCSAVVAALLRGQRAFAFRDRGLLALKGLAEPVAACEVDYEPGRPAALLTRTPFVGRTAELARLRQRLQETRGGRGGLIMLMGEPGIGKTRLVEELADSARAERALVLWGRCYEGDAARPYGPFVEALSTYARAASPETLRTDLGLGAAPLARLAPAIRDRLADVAEPVALQPDEERVRLLDAMAQFLLAVATHAPAVLMLDDLHWADAGTIAMLRHVARFAARGRLMVLGAYRDVDLDQNPGLVDALGALPRETTYDHVALSGLDQKEVAELLLAIADQDVPAALVNAITMETNGNPFFIREVLLHLVEDGKIFRQDERWAANLAIAEMGIPQSVRQVIQRRLARLSVTAQRLLGAAAGFTGTFGLDLAARVAGIDETAALDALDEALAAQLLRSTGSGDAFDFTHALVRHALYAQLSPPRQVRLHRQIAEAMEQAYGTAPGEHAGEIAEHYHRSATLPGAERGVSHALRAADQAERNAAFVGVVNALRIALDLLPESAADRPRLQGRLGLALAWSLALDEAVATATMAADLLAQTEGNAAAADYLAEAADVLWTAAFTPRAWSLAETGLRYIGARRDTTWARLMAYDIERREADDPHFPGTPLDSAERQEVSARLWELPAFRHVSQKMFAFLGFGSREDVLARAGKDVFALVFWAGEFQRALPILEEETKQAMEHGQIGHAAFSFAVTARVRHVLGDLQGFWPAYTRAVELHERTGEMPWLKLQIATALVGQLVINGESWEMMLAGLEAALAEDAAENRWARAVMCCGAAYAAAYLGRTEAALSYLESAVPAIDYAPGSTPNYPVIISQAVLTLEALGRSDHSAVIERNLRAKWLEPDFRYPLSDARQSLAILCGVLGRYEEAVVWFAHARAVLDAQGARVTRARNDLHEARMYLRRDAAGDKERVRALLGTALEQFHTIGMPGWIRLAEEMLAQVEPATDLASATDIAGNGEQAVQRGSHVPPNAAVFRMEGDYWMLGYEGITSRLKDAKGLQYLAHLLREPGRELHVVDLIQNTDARAQAAVNPGPRTRDAGLEVLDTSAKSAYRQRLAELREELTEAESFNDSVRAERARAEIEAIGEQLAGAVGLGGRDRTSGGVAERARSTVTKRIKDALRRIAAAHPTLGDHLTLHVKTGTYCVYLPDSVRPIEWKL